MKYLSKVVEIEAERVANWGLIDVTSNKWEVQTEGGKLYIVVSSQQVCEGDYLNVTDPDDIYHIPAQVFKSKYEPIEVNNSNSMRPSSPIMKYFTYEHLPANLKVVSKRIADVATYMDNSMPASPEKTAGLRKLLEAKDCFVRANLEYK